MNRYSFDGEDCPKCGASMEGDVDNGKCNSCGHKWGKKMKVKVRNCGGKGGSPGPCPVKERVYGARRKAMGKKSKRPKTSLPVKSLREAMADKVYGARMRTMGNNIASSEFEAFDIVQTLNGEDALESFSDFVDNSFCATGKGGGINPRCGKGGSGAVGPSGGGTQLKGLLRKGVGGGLGVSTAFRTSLPKGYDASSKRRVSKMFGGSGQLRNPRSGMKTSFDVDDYERSGRIEGGKSQRTGSTAGSKARGAARSGGRLAVKTKKAAEYEYVLEGGKVKRKHVKKS